MQLFELKADGQLPRDMVGAFGDPFTLRERLANKNFGLGHLRFKAGHQSLLDFYEQENNTIRTHFEWTTKGVVIRMRTMKKLFAIGLKDNQIQSITLTKAPDYIYATPFFPFWVLLQLGVRLSIAKWFRLGRDKIIYGPTQIHFSLTNSQILTYQQEGSLWSDCLSAFNLERIKDRLIIIDNGNRFIN